MFDIITLGLLPRVILLNRANQYYPDIGGVMTLELEECIKDAIEESMSEYVQSEGYVLQKQQVNTMLQAFRSGLSDIQKQQLNSMLDAISNCNGMFASEAYLHGVVEGIALRGKVVTE